MSEQDGQGQATPSAMMSRRAIVKAGGWLIPAVIVVGMPRNALAQSGSDAQPGNGGGSSDDV